MTWGSAIGDVLRAIAALEIDDDATAARVARMLGYTTATLPEQRPRTQRRAARSPVNVTVPARPKPTGGADNEMLGEPTTLAEALADAEDEAPDPPRPSLLEAEQIPEQQIVGALPQRPVPASLSLVRASLRLPADPPSPSSQQTDLSSVTADYMPPWPASWAPGIAFAAAASMVDLHRVDIGAVVARLAQGRRQGRLPTRHRLSGRRGLQLLLDHGDAMRPFLADREWIKELLTQAVGLQRVEVVHFRETLAGRVTTGPPLREHPSYRPPPPGVPILLFSDLGALRIGRRRRTSSDVLATLAPAHEITIITPCSAAAYPQAIREAVSIIPLDPLVRLRDVVDARTRRAPRHGRTGN
ncbi:hypothetical protein Q0Z83_025470 [Actinoplanes sichuanensis]|uniref:Uncharacterized protein n=1 Tax=Actinoplanes sichuanensis TaxID=512349 RepID=A0ABW4A0A8_9ACTN|nr:hypothetical protein [Actinoplanes sichuanensis]BEL04356.1 hypothetical protein Q0Z83_025470 [Actinoplanes sichuanensis]